MNELYVNLVCIGGQLVLLGWMWFTHRRDQATARKLDEQFEKRFNEAKATWAQQEASVDAQVLAIAEAKKEVWVAEQKDNAKGGTVHAIRARSKKKSAKKT